MSKIQMAKAARKAANKAHCDVSYAQTNELLEKYKLERLKEVDAKLTEAHNILFDLGVCNESDGLVSALQTCLSESAKMVNYASSIYDADVQILKAREIAAEKTRKEFTAKVNALGPSFITVTRVIKRFDFGQPMCPPVKHSRDDDDEHVSATDEEDDKPSVPNKRQKNSSASSSDSD